MLRPLAAGLPSFVVFHIRTTLAATGAIALCLALVSATSIAVADDQEPRADQSELVDEFWEVAHAGDARVGYSHTIIKLVERDGEMLQIEETEMHITTTRFGETQELVIRGVNETTADGTLLRMTETYVGVDAPDTVLEGLVEGDEFKITVTTGDDVSEQRIPWGAELISGMRFSSRFEEHEWQTDEVVNTTEYNFTNGVHTVAYTNHGEVETTLFDGTTRTLLQIEQQQTYADGSVDTSRYYVEPDGNMIKMELVAAGMMVERVSRDVAESTAEPMHETGTVIEVTLPGEMPPADLYRATGLTFQLRLTGLTADVVMSDLRQTVTQVDADTLEVHVTATPQSTDEFTDEELAACLTSGDYVDLDDPLLQSLAAEGIGEAANSLDKAIALESFVGEYVADDFSHLFEAASLVAVNKQGDCSEHSVLLVSLLRLNDIPARCAAGLFIDSFNHQALGHMWVEAYIDGHWMPLDATMCIGRISQAHIKFADWNLLENEAASAQFIQAVGIWKSPLEIEVLGGEIPE